MGNLEAQHIEVVKLLFGGSLLVVSVGVAVFAYVMASLHSKNVEIERPFKSMATVLRIVITAGGGCSLASLVYLLLPCTITWLFWLIIALFCICTVTLILGLILIRMED